MLEGLRMNKKLPIHLLMVGAAVLAGLWGAEFAWPATAVEKASMAQKPSPIAMRLSQDEAIALFLRQNFDLLITKFGIDHAKGQQITARLFPNPILSVSTLSAYTQGCNANKCGAVFPQIQQLFEMAGKRGYRMESAGFGARSAEASFEDAIRQLTFTVK